MLKHEREFASCPCAIGIKGMNAWLQSTYDIIHAAKWCALPIMWFAAHQSSTFRSSETAHLKTSEIIMASITFFRWSKKKTDTSGWVKHKPWLYLPNMALKQKLLEQCACGKMFSNCSLIWLALWQLCRQTSIPNNLNLINSSFNSAPCFHT